MKTIRIGSRESRLAVIQSGIVMRAIAACDPTVETELVTMKTTGDKIILSPVVFMVTSSVSTVGAHAAMARITIPDWITARRVSGCQF